MYVTYLLLLALACSRLLSSPLLSSPLRSTGLIYHTRLRRRAPSASLTCIVPSPLRSHLHFHLLNSSSLPFPSPLLSSPSLAQPETSLNFPDPVSKTRGRKRQIRSDSGISIPTRPACSTGPFKPPPLPLEHNVAEFSLSNL